MAANEYGNAATNQVTTGDLGTAPGVVLGNVQTNSGSVSASVAGNSFAVRGAHLSNGTLTMSGDQLAASATRPARSPLAVEIRSGPPPPAGPPRGEGRRACSQARRPFDPR